MTNNIACAVCDSQNVRRVHRKFAGRYGQNPVAVDGVEMYECDACGERFLTPEQARALSVAVKNQVRSELGLLSPEEIVEIRKKLGLSQSDLEHLLGLGSKVVTRWETGRVVQNKTADITLRLLDISPDNLTSLQKMLQRRPSKFYA